MLRNLGFLHRHYGFGLLGVSGILIATTLHSRNCSKIVHLKTLTITVSRWCSIMAFRAWCVDGSLGPDTGPPTELCGMLQFT
jgi:hypothetical protein